MFDARCLCFELVWRGGPSSIECQGSKNYCYCSLASFFHIVFVVHILLHFPVCGFVVLALPPLLLLLLLFCLLLFLSFFLLFFIIIVIFFFFFFFLFFLLLPFLLLLLCFCKFACILFALLYVYGLLRMFCRLLVGFACVFAASHVISMFAWHALHLLYKNVCMNLKCWCCVFFTFFMWAHFFITRVRMIQFACVDCK